MRNDRCPLSPNQFYYIFNHSNGHELLFRSSENYQFFIQRFQKHVSPFCHTLSYCLLPDSIHFLIRSKSYSDPCFDLSKEIRQTPSIVLSGQFSRLFNSYAKAFNKQHGRFGNLWNRPFKRVLLESEEMISSTIIYIHKKAEETGFIDQLASWPHSSFIVLASGQNTWLNTEMALKGFEDLQQFTTIHNQPSNRNEFPILHF